ncbi:MAG TPA: CHRD domain-containing protein [Thermoanaerobaculia bacterium]|nr:CHRD domain-containing protein [Thermoanaerobaculia bacterium]
MKRTSVVMLFLAVALLVAAIPVHAQGGSVITRLRGFEEVPATSTPGGGFFTATVNDAGTEVEWELSYFNIEGNVLQAHLHFGQKGVNGGIMVFLCSNLGNGPAGTQACPAKNGTISGTFTASNVLAVNAQSIAAGELGSLLRGLRAGVVYANVHTDQLPGGSIRGQLNFTP